MLAPLRSVNDQRFSWLRIVFLKLFEDWLNSVQKCQGNFESLSENWPENFHIVGWKTYEGLRISVNSIIEATQFLL